MGRHHEPSSPRSAEPDIRSAIASAAARAPHGVALIDARTEESLSYEGLIAGFRRVAARLADAGVAAGEPVLLCGTNSLDFAVTLLATMASGAVAMPVNPDSTGREIERLLSHSRARVAFVGGAEIAGGSPLAEQGPRLAAFPLTTWRDGDPRPHPSPPPAPDDGALLIYTSGTTGDPKGVLLTHGALVANVATAIDRLGLHAGHTTLALLPLFHTFALVSDVLPMLFCGGTSVIAPAFDVPSLAALEPSVRRWGVRSFSSVPLAFELMNRLGVSLRGSAMEFCVSGAAPLSEPTREAFAAAQGFPILPAYGMTESCCFCSISRRDAIVPGSAGVPVVEMRVLDDQGVECRTGDSGELVIRGPSVLRHGYFRDDRACYADGGWLRTGDLGRLDADGHLFITGRRKRMVIRGGEKIYLGDVDACLKRHPGVADALTVGLLDRVPERIVSFVVPREGGCDATAIAAWLRGEIGAVRSPDELRFIDRIPYTRTGKARVGELEARAAAS